MNVLFLGCGDIALRAIQQLLNSAQDMADFSCHGMRRHIEQLPATLSASAGDIRDTGKLTALLGAGCFDVVVVTLTPESMSDEGYRDSYVAGASSLSTALANTRHRPQGVIWVSSSGVYGQSDGEWVDERAETRPASYRGKRLLEAEQIIRQLPVRAVIVRYSGIYGPGRGRLLQQVREGRLVPAQPLQWSNRIHADDAAGVLVHIVRKWQTGEAVEPLYLASDDEPTPLHDVHAWLAGELGLAVFTPQGEKGDAADGRVGNRRCSNRLLRDSGFVFRYPTFRDGYRAILADEAGD